MSISQVTQDEVEIEEATHCLEHKINPRKQQRKRVQPVDVEPVQKIWQTVSVDVESAVSVDVFENTAPSPNW